MALIPCSECASQVSDKAIYCPTCGAPVPKIAPDKIRTLPPLILPKSSGLDLKITKKHLSEFGLLIMAGLIVYAISPKAMNNLFDLIRDAMSDAQDKPSFAMRACKQEIKERLISPSTARFQWDENATKSLDEQNFLVIGSINAQNKFGADIQSSISCTLEIKQQPDGKFLYRPGFISVNEDSLLASQ